MKAVEPEPNQRGKHVKAAVILVVLGVWAVVVVVWLGLTRLLDRLLK